MAEYSGNVMFCSGKDPLDDLPLIYDNWIDLSCAAELMFRERLLILRAIPVALVAGFLRRRRLDQTVRKALLPYIALRGVVGEDASFTQHFSQTSDQKLVAVFP